MTTMSAILMCLLVACVTMIESSHAHCDVGCFTFGGVCKDSCPSGNTFIKGCFPTCKGDDCKKCCITQDDNCCANFGGKCKYSYNDPNCPYGFERETGGSEGKCKNENKVCCIDKDIKGCVEANGMCREPEYHGGKACLEGEKVLDTNDLCIRYDHTCCVPEEYYECAKRGNRCFPKNSCPSGYESAGSDGGTCQGKDLKCCKPQVL